MRRKFYRAVQAILWALFFLSLPVTSFPYFPGMLGGAASVRPLVIYPLILLLALVILPRLIKEPLPDNFLPLLVFALVAAASTVFSLTASLDALRDVSPLARGLRGLATLALGSAMYVTVSLLPRTRQEIRFSLRWLYAGFGLALLWGSLQIGYVLKYSPQVYALLNQIQRYISSRKLMPKRISGFTYEPKWFAEQLCFLLIPWLLASVLSGRSVFAWRWRQVTVELVLLVWASVVLVFTYSRTGIFVLLLLVVGGFILSRIRTARSRPALGEPVHRKPGWWLRLAAGALLVLAALGGVVYAAGTQNNYFARLWTFWSSEEAGSDDYFEYIAFKQRFVFGTTAFRMFEAQPVLGVGAGNYAFYFDEMLPDEPWNRQPDILRQITHVEGRDKLVTPKNLYLKLLAETGLAGFFTFMAFILGVAGCAARLFFSPDDESRTWGLAGLFGLVVFFIVASSFDSYALPNMWVFFGLLTAASRIQPESRAENPA